MRSHSCRNRNFLNSRPLDVARVNACSTYATYFRDKNPGKLQLRFFCTSRSRLHLWPLYNPGLRIPRRTFSKPNPEYFFGLTETLKSSYLVPLPRKRSSRKLRENENGRQDFPPRHHHRIESLSSKLVSEPTMGWQPLLRGPEAAKSEAKFIPRRSIDFGLYCLKT